jgi:NADPH:quinone reductase
MATLHHQNTNTIHPMKSIESGIVRINRQGPPAVLEYTTDTVRQPGDNEVLIRQKAIALNFVDVLFRNGSFPLNNLPATIGVEAAGVVEAVGHNVTNFTTGDRVAYYFSLGAYAEHRLINPAELVKLPDDISFDVAASLLAKGLTARMLVKQAYPVQPGDVVLVHAAAGGVGSLVSRWAKALGATVIGTVGTASKKELPLRAGIDHVVALDTEDMNSAVQRITKNQGVQAVFDGVGKATFGASTPLVKEGGAMVLYGTASGNPSIDSAYLTSKGIRLVRPSLGQYLPDRQSIDIATCELFEAVRAGTLGKIQPSVYSLASVAQAHQDLESSQTTGSVILHP